MIHIDGEDIDRPKATPEDLERAIDAATRAFDAWSRTPAHRRAAILDGVAAGLRERREAFARRITEEARKPIQYARVEVDRAVATFTFAAAEARTRTGEAIAIDAAPGGDGRVGIAIRVPRGPVAAITPFNFPLNLVAHKVAPALACGATVVLKPAAETPLTATELAAVVARAGAPPGVLNVVPVDSDHAGPLAEDPRLRVLSFTGSSPVGWKLKARSGDKQVLLELGGNAAVILLADADVAAAIPRIIVGAFSYAGQVCIKAQRLFVHDSIFDRVVAQLVAAVETQAIVGDPADERVVVGPLIRARDADRVEAWIAEATARGAKVLTGGRREGNTIWPTVMIDVPPDAKVAREEVFGPVLVVSRFRHLDEAVDGVNDSPYGLQAGIYTADQPSLMRAFARLRVGALIHDDVPSYRADHMPYGGTKQSGVGREGPRYAMEEMTEVKLLVMRA